MTVAELITILQLVPSNSRVLVEDPDTNWIGDTVHITQYETDIVFWIKYHEIDSKLFPQGKLIKELS